MSKESLRDNPLVFHTWDDYRLLLQEGIGGKCRITSPFAFDQAKIIFDTELGKPVFEIYERFEVEPLASASIGQVHRARLITGEDVKDGING